MGSRPSRGSEAGPLLPLLLAALLAVPPLAPPEAAAEAPMPEGCAAMEALAYRCEWSFGLDSPTNVRAFPRTGLLVLALRSDVEAPAYFIWTIAEANATTTEDIGTSSGGAKASGYAILTPDRPEWSVRLLLDFDPAKSYSFALESKDPRTYTIVVEGREARGTLAAGVAAGSAEDPQLIDGVGDQEGPGYTDIAGGWFDDPVLDDGVITLGLHVPRLAEAEGRTGGRDQFRLAFTVLGTRYIAVWGLAEQVGFTGWYASFWRGADSNEDNLLIEPEVDTANGTLMMRVPLAELGDPPEGATFENMEAVAFSEFPADPTSAGGPSGVSSDRATTMDRPFAVGGPEVWARLRGEVQQSVVAPSEPFPWLLLGVGVAAAAALGGVGWVAVARRARPVRVAPAPGVVLLGKYHVERSLGAGAFGETWLARHLNLKRPVVLKRLHPEWASVAEAAARFRREAEILASLDHASVVRTYDVEMIDGAWYLVLEFVDGGSLDRRIEAGPLAPADARRVVEGILAGLAYVHARGVLHRDVKPANVLLTASGEAKVADFGVSRSADSTGLTRSEGSPGTPVYMAPEQVQGGAADARSDLYAAAVVAYEALTGRFYLDVDLRDLYALQRAIVEQPPVLDAAPAAWRPWLAKGLAKWPKDRFRSADEMLAALPRE